MTYEEIFERDGRWITGRDMLSNVVSFVRDKSLIVCIDEENPSTVHVEIPLPKVRDELSGEEVSVAHSVPPEVRDILRNQLNSALHAYLGDAGADLLGKFLRRPANSQTWTDLQSELDLFERSRKAEGEGQLWQVVATRFGLATRF